MAGPVHQRFASDSLFEYGASSAGLGVESMTSAISVAMLLIQVPLRVDGSAVIIAFAACYRGFESVTNRRRSAVLGVSFVGA